MDCVQFMAHKWVRFFKNEKTNIHDEERSSRPSPVNVDLVNKVNEKVHENSRFAI